MKMKWPLRVEAEEGTEGSSAPVGETSDSKIWDDLLNESEDAGEAEAEAASDVVVEEVGGEAEPETPAPVVAEEPKPEAPVVETAVVAEAQPPAPVVSQPLPVAEVPAVEAPPPPTEEQLKAWRQNALDGLAHAYAMSSEDAAALQIEPETVLPKLAANIHMRVVDQVMRMVAEGAPQLIEQTLRQQREAQVAEEAFFSRWGDLRPHRAKVMEVAQMWRQMYPKASLEEAINGIGSVASAMLGVRVAPQAPQAEPVPPPPPPPAGPSSRAAARPVAKNRLSPEEQAFVDFSSEIMSEEL